GLLEELTVAAHQADAATAPRVYALLVMTYGAAHFLLQRLGYADLAESVEHKLAMSAEHTSDPLAGGLVHWPRNQTFHTAGAYARGLRLMESARIDLEDELRRPPPAALTVYGSLHLSSAYLASRAGDAATTRDHLTAARDLSVRLGTSDQV